ncbi:BamA/TamA family outer membrane protein [Echinicola salinicaeni]|uniref:BamA/TamA family outer membrane protein n=1 Tax=Echinicola salinicaeni TaxID=2762757 RepID=UPI0016463FD2|nr:BamA/TamA family outer membrane protein [Echinicola salinicaeni]
MKRKALLFLIFQVFFHQVFAQEGTNASEKPSSSEQKIKIIWLPVLASNPANGFMIGVAPSSNWLMGPIETTSYSSALGSLIYTTKKQFLFTLKGSVYFKDNKSILMQDVRYFKTSQPTFGLGTGDGSSTLASNGFEYEDGNYSKGIDEAQMMKFNFFRLYETYFKRINDNGFYLGLGYHLDIHSKIEDQLLNLESEPNVITSHYAYSTKYGFDPEKYTLSGVSVNALYDTRDNTVSPYKGMYALTTLKFNQKWLGSSKNSSSLWAEYRTYFNLKKERPRNLLAVWAYGNFQLGGQLPYLDLPALGWDQFGRSGRAYPQGRFRGQSLIYGETEWRFPLQKDKDKWGGVLFLNATSATNTDADISIFENINTGYGLGIRYMLNEKSRTNLCLDYAFGNNGAHGFYLSVNEVF